MHIVPLRHPVLILTFASCSTINSKITDLSARQEVGIPEKKEVPANQASTTLEMFQNMPLPPPPPALHGLGVVPTLPLHDNSNFQPHRLASQTSGPAIFVPKAPLDAPALSLPTQNPLSSLHPPHSRPPPPSQPASQQVRGGTEDTGSGEGNEGSDEGREDEIALAAEDENLEDDGDAEEGGVPMEEVQLAPGRGDVPPEMLTVGSVALKNGKWKACRIVNGKNMSFGTAATKLQACIMHDRGVIRYLGPRAGRKKGINYDLGVHDDIFVREAMKDVPPMPSADLEKFRGVLLKMHKGLQARLRKAAERAEEGQQNAPSNKEAGAMAAPTAAPRNKPRRRPGKNRFRLTEEDFSDAEGNVSDLYGLREQEDLTSDENQGGRRKRQRRRGVGGGQGGTSRAPFYGGRPESSGLTDVHGMTEDDNGAFDALKLLAGAAEDDIASPGDGGRRSREMEDAGPSGTPGRAGFAFPSLPRPFGEGLPPPVAPAWLASQSSDAAYSWAWEVVKAARAFRRRAPRRGLQSAAVLVPAAGPVAPEEAEAGTVGTSAPPEGAGAGVPRPPLPPILPSPVETEYYRLLLSRPFLARSAKVATLLNDILTDLKEGHIGSVDAAVSEVEDLISALVSSTA